MWLTIRGMIQVSAIAILAVTIAMCSIAIFGVLVGDSCGDNSIFKIFETIKGFVRDLFQGRNFFGYLLSGIILCFFLPGMMSSIPIWFIKCTVCFIWRLGDKRGG